MKNCQVCEKHKNLVSLPGGAIYQSENIFIAHFPEITGEPAHRGHVILEVKRHITQLNQMNEQEALDLGKWTRQIAMAQQKVLGAEHVYLTRVGDVTPHLHFHFVPRYAESPKETWGPLHFKHEKSPKASRSEMIEISEKLREYLKDIKG